MEVCEVIYLDSVIYLYVCVLSRASRVVQSPLLYPDLKTIVPYVRHKVLKGARILFSGVCPLNQAAETCAIRRIAESLGAIIQTVFVAPFTDSAAAGVCDLKSTM